MLAASRFPVVALVFLGLTAAACTSATVDGNVTPPPSGPQGTLGVVTREDAQVAVDGLCGMQDLSDQERADAIFLDQVHRELHVIAAAAEAVDRAASARLLIAKGRVEEDLGLGGGLPPSYPQDLGELIEATQLALQTIRVPVRPCGK